jgi:hypothetical protein
MGQDLRGYVERKADPEGRAAALLALDLDPATVAVHDRLGDAQPQADALDRTSRGVPGAEEPAEDMVAVPHADADAGAAAEEDLEPGPERLICAGWPCLSAISDAVE